MNIKILFMIYENSIYYNYHDNKWRKIIKSNKIEEVINKGFKIKENYYVDTIKLTYIKYHNNILLRKNR